ncbi:MAG: ABC transporter substrate-binding protein [Candidatus Methanomethylophilaceae archaeon]|nr:ABC transporter substrate-binding protein [Candidatus Methanomethylophilaceae archaeon]
MDKKKTTAIFLVAILAIAAVAAMVLIGNGGGNDDKSAATGRLLVYGNADNNDYLDKDDLAFVKRISSGEITWNKNLHPLADVNCDGKVNQSDVTALENLLNKKSEKMYYINAYGNDAYINYPNNGTIGINFYAGFTVAQILGIYDRVTACLDSYKTYSEVRFPGVSGFYGIGDKQNCDVEKVLASGISIVIGYQASTLYDDLRATGKPIDFINLQFEGSTIGGSDPISSVLTLSVLLGCEDKGHEFVKRYDSTVKGIEKTISGIKKETMVVAYNPTSNIELALDSVGRNGNSYGDAWGVARLPLYDKATGLCETGYLKTTMEDLIVLDPDYIFISMNPRDTEDKTVEQIQKVFDEKVELFKGTRAYNEKNIYGICYSVMTTPLSFASAPLIASQLYPDLFSEEDAWKTIKEVYKDFVVMSADESNGELHVYSQK